MLGWRAALPRAGYVRRTTSRFCPDDPDKHMTINRPLTWNGKFAARFTPITVKKDSSGLGGNGSSGSGSSGNGSKGSSQPKR